MKNELSDDVTTLFDNLSIVSNKHNAARSAREQPCDLSSLFRSLRVIMQSMLGSSISDELRSETTMTHVQQSFQQARKSHGLDLGKKQHIIQSFLVCLPEAISRSASRESISLGFERSGLIDSRCKKFPCLKGVVDTLSRSSTDNDYQIIMSTFKQCFEEQCAKGHLSSSFLDTFDFFPQDENEGLRDTEIVTFQRSMTINHQHQQNIRKQRLMERAEKESVAKAEQQDKNKKQLYLNEKCEMELYKAFKKLPKNINEELPTISHDELQMCNEIEFNKCTSDLLKAFILARVYVNIPKQIPSEKVPTKKQNRVDAALKVKGDKIILCAALQELVGRVSDYRSVSPRVTEHIEPSVRKTPSDYLRDVSWRVLICRTIQGVKLIEPETEVSPQICDEADGCHEIAKTRYKNIFLMRNDDDKKHHYCFLWAWDNMACVIAPMTFFGHIRSNVHRFLIDRNSCLLALPNTTSDHGGVFISARSDKTKILEGNYLYFDTAASKWIRSGKACGLHSNYGIRENQHVDCSKDPSKSTMQFYQSYPDEGVVQEFAIQGGYFQYLHQYCGLSFKRSNVDDLVAINENGIFQWDAQTLSKLQSKVNRTLKESQLHMVSYLFEFVSGLCIGDANNVSQSKVLQELFYDI